LLQIKKTTLHQTICIRIVALEKYFRRQSLSWLTRLDRLTLNAIACFEIWVCSLDTLFWC